MPEETGLTTALRIARPTVAVAGQDNTGLSQGLLRLLIAETTQGLYRCEATFANLGPRGGTTDYLYFDRSLLDFGKAFAVKLGTDVLFLGRILGLEASFPQGAEPTLTVLAEDRFQDLRMVRRTRTFEDVSDADVLNQIASDHGLRADVDVVGPSYRVLAQVNQSDLAFLRERARATDFELWFDGSTLHAKARSGRRGSPISLNWGARLREFTVLADLAGQRTSVNAGGWDVSGKAALAFEATDSVLGGELNGDQSGASILSSALGPRKEVLAHAVPLSNRETQAVAESYFKLQARRFVVGHGVAETDSALRVGGTVELGGLGPLFSGKYYLAEVRHVFDGRQGLRTEFVGERPGLRG